MRFRHRIGLCVAGLASAGSALAAAPVLTLDNGQLSGIEEGDVVAYLGVPYAAPPVGAARWQPPAPVQSWTGIRAAAAPGPSCPQVLNPPEGRAPWTPEYLIPGAMSEDCLTLNIWRPAAATSAQLPVLVWLHGGGGVEGSNSVPVYDGKALARRGIVVVAINYRLGILSSFVHPLLSAEQGGASGNYGLQDSIAALAWVKANIAALGGDPARVTVAGQSAGAGLVTQLIASPMAKGLFAQAITQSGSQWGTRAAPTPLAAAEAQGEAFAASLGALTLAALRAMPAEALISRANAYAASGHGRFGNTLDGRVVTTDPGRAQASAGFNDTPILSGFNADEESGTDVRFGAWTATELARKRDEQFAPLAAEAATLYPASTDAEAQQMGKAMARERSRGLVYEWAKRRAPVTRNPIYIYLFDHPEPGSTEARYGSFHSSEIPYVFGNLDAPRPFGAADHKVSEAMSARWASFIKGEAPNAPGLVEWTPFDPANPTIMLLGDKEGAEPVLPPAKLHLFDALAEAGERARR